ncbi:hypothetical protein ACFPOE_02295 [Caenimonas terrae]|uniref:Uncharacterized protein n=1 Tax=Caenimonas terrae TaxID=696074 RepID=A0ABW0N6R5_9BURK
MNQTPRSCLTPADRDAAAFEASRLRALALRRQAIDAFFCAIGRGLRNAAEPLARKMFHTHKEA